MRRHRMWLAVFGAATLAGCGADDTTDMSGPGAMPSTMADAGDGSAVPPGNTAKDAGPTPPKGPATLTSATLANVGRHGDDLRITVKGIDPTGATNAAHLSFSDASGAPVMAFDTNWDGSLDASERRVFFDKGTIGAKATTQTITLAGRMTGAPDVAKVAVAFEGMDGARSNAITVDLVKQAARQSGDACDPAVVIDRCPNGMSCGGMPAACQPGVAPQFTSVAYGPATAIAGPKMMFRGSEPDQDMASINVEFLAANGTPITVDINNDGALIGAILLDTSSSSSTPTFFFQNNPAAGFNILVPKIGVTPTDFAGNVGARTIAAVTAAIVKPTGQPCDWNGFDSCASTALCAPGLATSTNTCTSAASLVTASCKAAPKLDPAKGATKAYGHAQGVSLWDAPPGCVPSDATERPEGSVSLHLATAAATLTITTALPETEFDTAVYLVHGCAPTSAAALGCNDDVDGFSSTLVLKAVPAGDYTIIVESVPRSGGNFGLSVKVD